MVDLNQLLIQMQNIAPNKQCVNFLINRIQSDSYRQIHISQHNRYTQYEVFIILKEIYNLVRLEPMQIRTEDLSKRPLNIVGEEKYTELTDNIHSKLGRCTQDSLRKNFFVDFHRMGFLHRFDDSQNLIPLFHRAHIIKYISLTETANRFLNADDFTKIDIYETALMTLGNQFFADLYEIIADLGSLSQDELMLFGTFLNQSFDNGVTIWRRNEIVELVKDFRTLTPNQQNGLIDCIQTYCNPTNFDGSKVDMRDFHNWLNQTQQIWCLLSQMPNFQVSNNCLYIN